MKSFIAKIGAYLVGMIVIATLSAGLFLYTTNRKEVRIAEQMVRDLSQFQIGESGLNDVLAFARKYNGEATGSWHGGPCVESDCLIRVTPTRGDFWERHPKLGEVAIRVSRRAWHFGVLIWVRQGKVTAIEQSFGYSTPHSNPFVIVTTSQPSLTLCHNRFYRLHDSFAANPAPHHFNVWINPSASKERETLRPNVDCVLRVSGCKDAADMVPEAWKRYEADQLVLGKAGKGPDKAATDPICSLQ